MDQSQFTKKEFARECVKRGYAIGGERAVLRWCKDHEKEFYTESDMIAVYRYFDACKIGDLAQPRRRARNEYFYDEWE